MRLLTEPADNPERLGLLPGTFNPPTRAHIALAEAALSIVDEVFLVLPSALPHKTLKEGATPEQRLEMLVHLVQSRSGMSAATSDGGLFIDIAREARQLYPGTDVYIVCGRDAAERIVNWDYGDASAIQRFLREFRLLVSARGGSWEPPAHLAAFVQPLDAGNWDNCAATAIRRGAPNWRELVPDEIADLVERYYSPDDASRNVRRR